MKIRVSIGGKIVVDGEIDAFNVDTSAKDVGSNADTLVEFFEFFVALDTGRKLVLVVDEEPCTTYRSS